MTYFYIILLEAKNFSNPKVLLIDGKRFIEEQVAINGITLEQFMDIMDKLGV